MTIFHEKLNVKENKEPYQIEEEIPMESGRYEGFLRHDNVLESSIALYTGKKLTGEKVENFVLSIDESYPWRTFIRVASAHERLYLSYETIGDVIEADDINELQKAVMKLERDMASVDTSAFVTSEEFNRLKQSSLDAKTAHIQAIEEKAGQSSGLTTSSSWRDILYFWSNVVSGGSGSGGLNFAQLFFKVLEFERSLWESGQFDPSSLTTSHLSQFFKNPKLHLRTVSAASTQLHLQTNSKLVLVIFKQKKGYGEGAEFLKFHSSSDKFQMLYFDNLSSFSLANDNAVSLKSVQIDSEGDLYEDVIVFSDRFLYIFPENNNIRTYDATIGWKKHEGQIYIFETDGFL